MLIKHFLPDDEARYDRIHDPVQHADPLPNDRSQIGVEVDSHHSFIYVVRPLFRV